VNTSAGTSTAYTLTTESGVTATPVTGQMVSFIAHATNGASPTMTVDGGNTYPLQMNGASAVSGTIVVGSPYRMAFNGTAWTLEAGYGNPYGIPLGGFLASTGPTAPNSSFVEPAGQCISTTTYAAYWVQQGSPASGACPGGQFAVIDLRGRVPVPLDTLNGSPANRLTNSATGCGTAMTSVGAVCTNGAESKTIATANLPPYTPTGTNSTITASNTSGTVQLNVLGLGTGGGGGAPVPIANSANITVTGPAPAWTGNAQGGTSTPLPVIPPMIGVKYYLRVI